MTQLEMLTTLVDAARQLPENRILGRALWRAERRIEVLRARRARQTRRLFQFYDAQHRLLCESFRVTDRPQFTEHVVSFKVWRYPEAQRPSELDRQLPYAEGIYPP